MEKVFPRDVLSVWRTQQDWIALARATGDPLNVLWALRAESMRAVGRMPRLEELDEDGHPGFADLEYLVRVHGLEWANLRAAPVEERARYGASVSD